MPQSRKGGWWWRFWGVITGRHSQEEPDEKGAVVVSMHCVLLCLSLIPPCGQDPPRIAEIPDRDLSADEAREVLQDIFQLPLEPDRHGALHLDFTNATLNLNADVHLNHYMCNAACSVMSRLKDKRNPHVIITVRFVR